MTGSSEPTGGGRRVVGIIVGIVLFVVLLATAYYYGTRDPLEPESKSMGPFVGVLFCTVLTGLLAWYAVDQIRRTAPDWQGPTTKYSLPQQARMLIGWPVGFTLGYLAVDYFMLDDHPMSKAAKVGMIGAGVFMLCLMIIGVIFLAVHYRRASRS